MGVGYQASALHHILYAVKDDQSFSSEPPPDWPFPAIPGAHYGRWPLQLRSPDIVDVIAWRDRLSAKYQNLLGELLSWDETSDFMASDDIGTDGDVALRYVAAFVDGNGPEAVRKLVGVPKPSYEDFIRVFAPAESRGLSGQFPQLVIAPKFWLPFHRDTVIEEPDWEGRPQQFGSVYRLEDELRVLARLIGNADPSATEPTADFSEPVITLHAAWQAISVILRLCSTAASNHLPFWTTG